MGHDDDVVAIALQCISFGYSTKPENPYYADVHFTFKQAYRTTSGHLRHIYTSQHDSISTWKTDDKKGI